MTFKKKTRHGEVSKIEGKISDDRHRAFPTWEGDTTEFKGEIGIDGFDADGNRKCSRREI